MPVGRSTRKWVNNIGRNVKNLEFQGSWKDEGLQKMKWKKMVVTASGFGSCRGLDLVNQFNIVIEC